MPDNISKYNRERAAKQALAHAEDMANRALKAVEDAKRNLERLSIPDRPADGEYRVDVQFERGGKTYVFLVLVRRFGIYTTMVENGGQFTSWTAFVEWLRGKDAHYVSEFYRMDTNMEEEGLDLGC